MALPEITGIQFGGVPKTEVVQRGSGGEAQQLVHRDRDTVRFTHPNPVVTVTL